MKILVLASSSPRRINLLKKLGIDFLVIPPKNAKEVFDGRPSDIVLQNSRNKVLSVISSTLPKNSIIVGADTLVVDEYGRVYGKPLSIKKELAMLKMLRGKWHNVVTGVTVFDRESSSIESFVVCTRVKMRMFSDEELRLYVASLEGLDKAGGYAIQGLGSLLIEEIEGDPFNVIGLPLSKLHEVLLKYGLNILEIGVKNRIARTRGPYNIDLI